MRVMLCITAGVLAFFSIVSIPVLVVITSYAEAKSIVQYSRALPKGRALRYSRSTKCLPSILKRRLRQIKRKFGPIQIISTYRPGARIRGSGRRSKHASCRAVDFKVKNKWAVYRWLSKKHVGGVGIYSGRCNHIHIDNGGNYRWHSKRC